MVPLHTWDGLRGLGSPLYMCGRRLEYPDYVLKYQKAIFAQIGCFLAHFILNKPNLWNLDTFVWDETNPSNYQNYYKCTPKGRDMCWRTERIPSYGENPLAVVSAGSNPARFWIVICLFKCLPVSFKYHFFFCDLILLGYCPKVKATFRVVRSCQKDLGVGGTNSLTNFCNHTRSNHSATALVARVQLWPITWQCTAWDISVTQHTL